MNMNDIIKEYLDKCAETDAAFKAAYKPNKIDDCMKEIEKTVRESLNMKTKHHSSACAVKDEDIFKLARDYFIDGKMNLDENNVLPMEQPKNKDPEEQQDDETEEEFEERLKRIKEEKKKAELERIEREQKERERKQYEKEHEHGQMTIFDLGA